MGAPWLEAWRFDPVVAGVLLVLGGGYAWGWQRASRVALRRRVGTWRAVAFATGVATLAIAWLSPLHGLDRQLLAASFGSMFLVSMVAPPLLLLGRPLTVAFIVGSPSVRRRLRAVVRSRPARWLTFPVTTWLLFAGVTYAWQFSSLAERAMRSEPVWLAQQSTLLAVGLLFWWPALCSDPPPWRMGYALRAFYVLVEMTHKALFGGMFLAAQQPFHPGVVARYPTWAPEAMVDQRLAILLVWVGGSLVFLAAAAGVVRQWVAFDARYSRRLDARLARERAAEERRRAALERVFQRPL